MSGLRSSILGSSLRVKALSVVILVLIIISGISLFYLFRPLVIITNDPVYITQRFPDQHVLIYSVDINGNNITVGEIGLTWEITYTGNTSEYDYYELTLRENVRGSAADSGKVGWIEGGQTLIDFRSESLMTRDWSETHGEGAVEVVTSTNSSWDGSIEWRFTVLLGSGSFKPREATNSIEFILSIRAIQGADVNLTIYAFTDWSLYGYSLDRTLVQATEVLVIDLPSQRVM